MAQRFEVSDRGDQTIVTLTDLELLDRLITSELQQELVEFVEREQPDQLVVSFNNVQRCSTEIINALLRARKRVAGYQGTMKLCNMRREIREVFRMLNLDGSVFHIYDTQSDAVASFGAAQK